MAGDERGHLDLEKSEAARCISERAAGVASRERDGEVEFRTNVTVHVPERRAEPRRRWSDDAPGLVRRANAGAVRSGRCVTGCAFR